MKRILGIFRLHKMAALAWAVFRTFLLIGISFMLLYPILYMLSTAFRDIRDLWDPSVTWIPNHFTLRHVKEVFTLMDYPKVLFNTVKLSLISTLLQLLSCSLVGYGFAKFDFKWKKVLFALVLLTIIVPPQTIIVPLYMEFRFFSFAGISKILGALLGGNYTVNLLNTGWTFYLPSLFGMGLRSGLYIYIFRQFFRGIPKELEDASFVDGCGPFKTFFKIVLPNAVPAMLTIFFFSLIWHWNDYFVSGMLLTTNETISNAIVSLRVKVQWMENFNKDYMLNQVRIQAGALLSILPMMIVFAIGQKYFRTGIERTGIVG